LTAEPVAWVPNCQPHDVPVLVAVRRLNPLGNPPANSALRGSEWPTFSTRL